MLLLPILSRLHSYRAEGMRVNVLLEQPESPDSVNDLKRHHCWEKELRSQEIAILSGVAYPNRNGEAKNWQRKSRVGSTAEPRPRPRDFFSLSEGLGNSRASNGPWRRGWEA